MASARSFTDGEVSLLRQLGSLLGFVGFLVLRIHLVPDLHQAWCNPALRRPPARPRGH